MSELACELVVRHAGAIAFELAVKLDPGLTHGCDVDRVDGGGGGQVGVDGELDRFRRFPPDPPPTKPIPPAFLAGFLLPM